MVSNQNISKPERQFAKCLSDTFCFNNTGWTVQSASVTKIRSTKSKMVHDYKLLKTDKYRKEKKQLLPNAWDIIWDSKLNLNLEINRKFLHFEKFQNKEMLWHRIKNTITVVSLYSWLRFLLPNLRSFSPISSQITQNKIIRIFQGLWKKGETSTKTSNSCRPSNHLPAKN